MENEKAKTVGNENRDPHGGAPYSGEGFGPGATKASKKADDNPSNGGEAVARAISKADAAKRT